MKINKPSIDILVGITNWELLHGNMSTTAYGEALARTKQELENYGKTLSHVPHNIHREHKSAITAELQSDSLLTCSVGSLEEDWMSHHTDLYILCRDTDLSFEEYLDLCDAIGDTVVHHGKVIANQEQLSIVLAKAKRIHIPSNLMRYWQGEQQELWDTLQNHWDHVIVWSTVHNEDDISFLRALQIPRLECVLVSPIFPTACKEGHPGIGVKKGEALLQYIREHYPHVQGIALGGIHEHNYVECLQHTFTGVAIMSEFMKHVYSTINI